jgi:hypothetical protein
MAGHPEASLFPRFDEAIRLVRSVERDARTVVFQLPVHLRKRWIDPGVAPLNHPDHKAFPRGVYDHRKSPPEDGPTFRVRY